MASTIFSGLNKFFNLLFSSKAMFSLAFVVVISAALALILCCIFLELWTTGLLCHHYPLLQMPHSLPSYVFPCCWTSVPTDPGIGWNFWSQGKTNIVPWPPLWSRGLLEFGWNGVSMFGSPHWWIWACKLHFFWPALAADLQIYLWSFGPSETSSTIRELTVLQDSNARLRWSISLWKDCSLLGLRPNNILHWAAHAPRCSL